MEEMQELMNFAQFEITQRGQEGCDVKSVKERFDRISEMDTGIKIEKLNSLIRDVEALKPEKSFPYVEPSTLEEIKAVRPQGPRRMELNLTDSQIYDHIYGAWLGRAAGCALGKPVEGWDKKNIDSYLQFAGALPLTDYIPLIDGHSDGLKPHSPESTRGKISFMARDDDMDYTVLGLHILERFGPDFTARNVADTWLFRLPYHLVYTAERVAYRNLVNNIWPPESASYRNPFREWIGAQIRADSMGYVAPGWPEKAAEFAFRDAMVSHVKNGIYGEMFVAAMLAAAFVTNNVEDVINIGLSEIPGNCRLAEAVRDTVHWCKKLNNWEQVWTEIDKKYGHYHRVHTINNAALVVMGLMFAQLDYETSIIVAVRGGWDTDCNGATGGSVSGMMLGADGLPEKWVNVLNDRLLSAVVGFNDCKISELAKRTQEIAQKVSAEN